MMQFFIDGDQLVVTEDDFINLQESSAYFVDLASPLADAIRAGFENVADEMGFQIIRDERLGLVPLPGGGWATFKTGSMFGVAAENRSIFMAGICLGGDFLASAMVGETIGIAALRGAMHSHKPKVKGER